MQQKKEKLVHNASLLCQKLAYLDDYLSTQQHITLARALGTSDGRMGKFITGEEMPTHRMCVRIAEYFFLDVSYLLDDEKVLPNYENLHIDEELASIQRDDPENKIQLFKNKHYISKNAKVLSAPKRLSLIINILIIMVPLLVYTGYCGYLIAQERVDTLAKYKQGSDETYLYDAYDEQQQLYYNNLSTTDKHNNADAYYCDVTVGVQLERIKNISSSTSSYEARLQLYFKFDKEEFKNMFRHYATNVLWDSVMNEYYDTCSEAELNAGRDETLDAFLKNAVYGQAHNTFFDNWIETNDERFYPGETPSNVLVDKETMFDIGNGEFVADSYGTLKELEETTYTDEEGNTRTLCYQKVKFNAQFEKAFDSVRYPLDSVQFKMYILPIMDSQYIRYTPDRETNAQGERLSGFTPYFGITNGYRLVNNDDGVSNFTLRVHYYRDVNNDPAVGYDHTYRTELEIVVRANRSGISLFLKAFINLFSVVIWITIAFYNQSHNSEDSIGMLGTGLFGVISSMLVGLSMVSDAGIFSLMTMINVFTLAVIMIMTYQSVAAKRAQVRKDKAQIIYNGIKLRLTFYILSLCTVMMFVGLPLISYMFGL